jgi:pimeloyl-ACP methyl ester carboxylesterase
MSSHRTAWVAPPAGLPHDGRVTATEQRSAPTSLHGTVDLVDGRHIQVLTTTPGDAPVPDVVLLPGLGLPGYLVNTIRALADRGLTCTLLDLPGFGGSGPRACGPSVAEVADAAAAWLLDRCTDRPPDRPPVVLVGHSTGAQTALLAAVQLPVAGRTRVPVGSVVLAGPTVAPEQRGLLRLVAKAPLAYRRDSPKELLALEYVARWGPDVVRMLASATRDAPEQVIERLGLPVVITAGRADAFAPTSWLTTLSRHAVRSPSVRVVRLPGSHNNPFTHPGPFSGLVAGLVRSTTARVRAS